MRNIFFSFLILSFLAPTISFATPVVPQASVWMDPAAAEIGDSIELNAFVYNSTQKNGSITVLFATSTEELASVVIDVPAQTAKVAVTKWKIPEISTVVTASVTKAIDSSKKNMPELLGVIGTVTVGSNTKKLDTAGLGGILKKWFAVAFSSLDPWRVKQAEKYTTLRDKKKEELGVGQMKDIYANLVEDNDVSTGESSSQEQKPTATEKFGGHAILVVATMLAALFTSVALFYIALILLALFVLRFLFRIVSSK